MIIEILAGALIVCVIAKYAVTANTKAKTKPGNNTTYTFKTKEYQNTQGVDSAFPYRKKSLLTPTEKQFYDILKVKCDSRNLLIYPKVRIEDYIEVTTQKQKNKYRGRIKSRHIDFLVCDAYTNILMAIELDDRSHNTPEAQEVDEFKNKLFEHVNIPLARIKTNPEAYNAEIERNLNLYTRV